ncbi:MAG: hypothetical protein K1Y01_02360 [Vicinamibacteria bacterium]|nr:hypothetical protein [Vicinamibacteria bacterium]
MATFIATLQTPRPRSPRSTRLSPHRRLLSRAAVNTDAGFTTDRKGHADDNRPISLLDEARRRLKSNMLANIELLRLVEEDAASAFAEAALSEMEDRLQSMAALHKARCRAGDFDRIDLAVYLRQAAALRNSPPRSSLPGGWVAEPGGGLVWMRDEDDGPGTNRRFGDLETALAETPAHWRPLARLAAYACAIVAPPWIFRWVAPPSATTGRSRAARPGEVAIRIRVTEGVAVEVSMSDSGPGLPDVFEGTAQRALSLELVSVLARLVQGSLGGEAGPEAVFDVAFLPSRNTQGATAPMARAVA